MNETIKNCSEELVKVLEKYNCSLEIAHNIVVKELPKKENSEKKVETKEEK